MDPIASLTVTLEGANDQRCIDGWVAVANAMGQPVAEYLQSFVREQGREYANRYGVGMMPSSAFLLRFSPAEIGAIMQAAETDPHVAALLAEVRREANVATDDHRVGPGLQYLVAVGLLAPERLPEVLAYSRPIQRDYEAEAAEAEAELQRQMMRGGRMMPETEQS